jgi:hypothetical protein
METPQPPRQPAYPEFTDAEQDLTDRLIVSLGRRESLSQRSHVLRQIQEALAEDGRLAEWQCESSYWVSAVDPAVMDRNGWFDNHLGERIATSRKLTLLRRFVRLALAWNEEVVGMEYPFHYYVPLRARNGATAILGARFVGPYIADPDSTEWCGCFRDVDAFRAWLRQEGWWTDIEQFDLLPRTQQLARWPLD